MSNGLSIGQAAPDLILPRDGGTDIRLADLRPKQVVLFTYGADGTPSCTNEVMEFNAFAADFAAAGCFAGGVRAMERRRPRRRLFLETAVAGDPHTADRLATLQGEALADPAGDLFGVLGGRDDLGGG